MSNQTIVRLRAAVGAGALIGAVMLIGCGGGGSGGSALPAAVAVAAPQVYVALGDSITASIPPAGAAPDANTSYAWLYNSNVIDLGISGETAIGAITDELPQVPANATLVSIFLGVNDIYVKAMTTGETTADYAAAMRTIVTGVRSKAPQARVVVFNLPNYSSFRLGDVVGANDAIGGLGIPVIDLYDDTAYLTELQTVPVGNIHPTAAGQAELVRLLRAAAN